MEIEIQKHRRSIFDDCYKSVKAKLSKIPETIQQELRVYTDAMRDKMISDYNNVILGVDGPVESKGIRESVFELLQGIDEHFQQVSSSSSAPENPN
jgi:hypothetical protein